MHSAVMFAGTRATQLALEAAARGGAKTALVTAVQDAPVDHVITTPVHDDRRIVLEIAD